MLHESSSRAITDERVSLYLCRINSNSNFSSEQVKAISCNFRADLKQFQDSFRAVSERYQYRFKAISEQLSKNIVAPNGPISNHITNSIQCNMRAVSGQLQSDQSSRYRAVTHHSNSKTLSEHFINFNIHQVIS